MQELSQASLRRKENQSIHTIYEAVSCARRPALLWSLGKDSTTLLHLVRKAYFGRVPFPVVHLDTGYKFPEMYAFRDRWARQWGLDLIVARNEAALAEGVTCCMDREMTCCHRLKTQALQQVVARHGFDMLLVGIRRDEHGIRAKERYFSPRDEQFLWDARHQPVEVPGIAPVTPADPGSRTHFRVHPLLHWCEIDVWSYMRLENLPAVELYFARDGRRYRSLGCMPATEPSASDASDIDGVIAELCETRHGERSGRAQDKESVHRMERLRSLGYL